MTKIQKKKLRRRQAQLPINFPAPDVIPFDFEKEKARIENICRRLADNEVEVRDAVMKELPQLLREIMAGWSDATAEQALERWYASELAVASPYKKPTKAQAKATNALTKAERRQQRMEMLKQKAKAAAEEKQALADDAVSQLQRESLQLDKLCLGLFFCLWHSDKPLVQLACCDEIAALLRIPRSAPLQAMFTRSFFRILSRQWGHIDQWRMDKYMSLVRRLIFVSIDQLFSHYEPTELPDDDSHAVAVDLPQAASKAMQWFEAIFAREILLSSSVGLCMHICDVILAELNKLKDATPEFYAEFMSRIPLYAMSRGDTVEKRVVDNLLVPIAAGALETAGRDTTFSATVAKAVKLECRRRSISRHTLYTVRPLISECEQVMNAYLERIEAPETFEPVSKRERISRIAKDVEHANAAAVATAQAYIERKKHLAKKMGPRTHGKKKASAGPKPSSRSRHSKRRKTG